MKATRADAYRLFHEGAIELARIERHGMRVDVDLLDRKIGETKQKIEEQEQELRSTKVYRKWKRAYPDNMNIDSGTQLAHVLFERMGFPCKYRTSPTERFPEGQPKTDDASLSEIDDPFVKGYLKVKKLKTALNTFLYGIKKEVVDGYIHPFYNLHIARTYRSSSSDPNSQNFPVRNEEMAELVRSLFIPRDGHQLVEYDFKTLEVAIAACYNKDPTLIDYIKNSPPKDMHRDTACDLYFLKEDQVTKEIRHGAKNQFVFPQFYGSYYIDCAMALWTEMERRHLVVEVKGDKIPLREFLKTKGIRKLGKCIPEERPEKGTFEYRCKQVEDLFWNERFPVYTKWKKKWYEQYLETGGFDLLTGFRVEGDFKRNQVINYPVQGAAFHCLLWSIIRMSKWLRKYKMKSRIICQIHDSSLSDVYPKELSAYKEKMQEIMTVDLPKYWKWIIVPMGVEAEISPVNGNWFQKAKVA